MKGDKVIDWKLGDDERALVDRIAARAAAVAARDAWIERATVEARSGR